MNIGTRLPGRPVYNPSVGVSRGVHQSGIPKEKIAYQAMEMTCSLRQSESVLQVKIGLLHTGQIRHAHYPLTSLLYLMRCG